jgi:hypothetical protein
VWNVVSVNASAEPRTMSTRGLRFRMAGRVVVMPNQPTGVPE